MGDRTGPAGAPAPAAQAQAEPAAAAAPAQPAAQPTAAAASQAPSQVGGQWVCPLCKGVSNAQSPCMQTAWRGVSLDHVALLDALTGLASARCHAPLNLLQAEVATLATDAATTAEAATAPTAAPALASQAPAAASDASALASPQAPPTASAAASQALATCPPTTPSTAAASHAAAAQAHAYQATSSPPQSWQMNCLRAGIYTVTSVFSPSLPPSSLPHLSLQSHLRFCLCSLLSCPTPLSYHGSWAAC